MCVGGGEGVCVWVCMCLCMCVSMCGLCVSTRECVSVLFFTYISTSEDDWG